MTVTRDPSSDSEPSTKKYTDDQLDKNTIVRFNQTLESYFKVSVGNDTYNLTKNNKIQLRDTAIIKAPNSGAYCLQSWNIKCIDKNGAGKNQRFVRSTKTNSPTGNSGATPLPPIGDALMYIETYSNKHGNIVFVCFERIDVIQITSKTFYFIRFSILTDDNLKSIGRSGIQLLLADNWSTHNTIVKNDRYSDNSIDWTLLKLDFTVENYGNKLILDQIHMAHVF